MKALQPDYPTLDQVVLKSFDLHALGVSREGSSAPVRILMEFSTKDGSLNWEMAGVSRNSTKAGLRALIDGLHWYLTITNVPNKN